MPKDIHTKKEHTCPAIPEVSYAVKHKSALLTQGTVFGDSCLVSRSPICSINLRCSTTFPGGQQRPNLSQRQRQTEEKKIDLERQKETSYRQQNEPKRRFSSMIIQH